MAAQLKGKRERAPTTKHLSLRPKKIISIDLPDLNFFRLCLETWKRCKFFVDVFALKFPDEMSRCEKLPISNDPEVCVGRKEVSEAITRSKKPRKYSIHV